jgi:cation diffusion facilitator family transporter
MVMMIIAGFNIIHEAIERLLSGVVPNITYYSFAAIIISLFISLSISIYERTVGKRTSSAILIADSFHTLTDVFASLIVIASFIGTSLGVLYADSIAAIIICGIIAYMAVSLFRSSTRILVDQGVSSDILAKIRSITNGVCGDEVACHAVRGKVVGDKLFVDMHVTVKGELSVEESHRITETIERRLKEEIKGTEEVIIHTEPRGEHDHS